MPGKWVIPIALAIALIGLWDQLPPKWPTTYIQRAADLVALDRNFAAQLEAKLPQNSMIFQLPVAAFPEIPPIYQMGDYEHLRPYLFTHQLHYSYGTNKGRGDADWQIEVSELSPAEMIVKLEAYGFGAIMINRKGYEDKGARLIVELVNANRPVFADNGELVAIKLKPASTPLFPKTPVPKTSVLALNVYKQEITPLSAPLRTLKTNETVTMQIRVKNIGNEAWPSRGIDEKELNRVGLGFYWTDSSGKDILPGRALLLYDLMPGSASTIEIRSQAPSQSGDYALLISMVQEHVAWFHHRGATPLVMNVKVK